MPHGTRHVRGTDDPAPPRRHDLVDDQILEEIELLFDVISRVAGHDGYLSTDEVDTVLGVSGVTHGAFRAPEDIDAFALHAVDLAGASALGGRCPSQPVSERSLIASRTWGTQTSAAPST